MAIYAPPGSRQYSETLPKAPGQPGFRPTQPQTDFSKKMPGAPGSSLDNARRAGPMTQGGYGGQQATGNAMYYGGAGYYTDMGGTKPRPAPGQPAQAAPTQGFMPGPPPNKNVTAPTAYDPTYWNKGLTQSGLDSGAGYQAWQQQERTNDYYRTHDVPVNNFMGGATQTAQMPQAPAQGFTLTTSPAMMLGPQSPAPVAPMYGGSQGYMNQPVQGSTGGAYIGDTNPSLGLMMGGRDNLGNYEYNAATDPATAYQRTAGYAKNKADQAQFAQEQNQWGSNTAGFQQHLQGQLNAARAAQQPQLDANNAAGNQLTAQYMAARGIGANGQQLGGRQFAQPQMTPLQQMVRNRGAGGGDFVGQWTPPPKFASQAPSPQLPNALLQGLYGG